MRSDAYIVNFIIKQFLRFVCCINDTELRKIPDTGPLILASNHVNFLEVPLLYTHLIPRPITGFVKAEGWKNPFLHYLADLWDAIPLHREEADVAAIRSALSALKAGKIIGLAPEGTRSRNGRLGHGHPGVVILALQSGAPIMPLVFFGSENYTQNWKRLRKTPFNIIVGNPFYLAAGDTRVNRDVRQQMTNEIMYQLAALLPPLNRGVYSSLNQASDTHLHFPPHSQSNLLHAI